MTPALKNGFREHVANGLMMISKRKGPGMRRGLIFSEPQRMRLAAALN
ncbi:MAG: hypothetical protein U1E81_04855 [Xanthobacteraceae bacterium]